MPKPILTSHPVTGEQMSLNALAKSAGMNTVTLVRRYRRGLRGAELLSKENLNGPREASQPGWGRCVHGFARPARASMARRLADVGSAWMLTNAPLRVDEHADFR